MCCYTSYSIIASRIEADISQLRQNFLKIKNWLQLRQKTSILPCQSYDGTGKPGGIATLVGDTCVDILVTADTVHGDTVTAELGQVREGEGVALREGYRGKTTY